MAKSEVVSRAWTELAPAVKQLGYDLIEVEYSQHGGRWILRLFIDREGGIRFEDCAAVTQAVDPILDELDFIGGQYAIEVSSPGIDRPIRKPEDFERFSGEPVKLKTHAPVQGRKRFTGVLQGIRDGLVLIECEGTLYECHIENVLKANLDR